MSRHKTESHRNSPVARNFCAPKSPYPERTSNPVVPPIISLGRCHRPPHAFTVGFAGTDWINDFWWRIRRKLRSMAEETIEKSSSSEEEKNKAVDPTFFSCLLQPSSADSDPQYIGIRRLLLRRKAESGVHRRKVCFGFAILLYFWEICFERESWKVKSDLSKFWERIGYYDQIRSFSYAEFIWILAFWWRCLGIINKL